MIKQFNNLISTPLAVAASVSIPKLDWQWYHKYNSKTAYKYGSVDPYRIPTTCKIVIETITTKVCEYFDNEHIFPDFDLHGGGIHIIPPSGWLSRHLDAEYHPTKLWKRAGSLVWFANQEWKDSDGGELIIEEPFTGKDTIHYFKPVFNTAIYFDTDSTFHQVTKNTGSQDRKTLAIFFWKEVNIKPEDAITSAYFKEE